MSPLATKMFCAPSSSSPEVINVDAHTRDEAQSTIGAICGAFIGGKKVSGKLYVEDHKKNDEVAESPPRM